MVQGRPGVEPVVALSADLGATMSVWYDVWWVCDDCAVESQHPLGWAIAQAGEEEQVDLCPKCAGEAGKVDF